MIRSKGSRRTFGFHEVGSLFPGIGAALSGPVRSCPGLVGMQTSGTGTMAGISCGVIWAQGWSRMDDRLSLGVGGCRWHWADMAAEAAMSSDSRPGCK